MEMLPASLHVSTRLSTELRGVPWRNLGRAQTVPSCHGCSVATCPHHLPTDGEITGTVLSLTCESQSLYLFPTMAMPVTLRTHFSPGHPTDQRLQPWVLCGCWVPDVMHTTDSCHCLFQALSWMVILITFLRTYMQRQWFTSSNLMLHLE